MTCVNAKHNNGFSLIELLVVVVLLGLMGAVAVPQFAGTKQEMMQSAFVNDVYALTDAIQLYQLDHDAYLPNTKAGELPEPLRPYIPFHRWEYGTPIGGAWDYEANKSLGFKSAIGVRFSQLPRPSVGFMEQIDARTDDGDLHTGWFTEINKDRYYSVVTR